MANEARRTGTQLLAAIRANLDESSAAFWTDANLYKFITRAAHAVATEVRRLKADYFLISRLSTDGSVTILGETYATSSFAIVAGTKQYTLPPDLLELKSIEVITSGYEDVVFHFGKDMNSPEFRGRRTLTTNQSPSLFYADVVGERTLLLSHASDTALDLRLWYVSSAVLFDSNGASQLDMSAGTDTLMMPFPGYMAVEEVATARAQIMDRNDHATVYMALADQSVARLFGANARQTSDPEYVQGTFE